MSYLEVRVALEVPDSQRPESLAPPFLLVNLETRDVQSHTSSPSQLRE